MRLTAETVMEGVVETLRAQVSPQLADGYAGEALRMGLALVAIVGRAGDDAAALRAAENGRMRALLVEGARLLAAGDLAARLGAAAQSADPGLRISELDAETGRLRLLLIELQVRLEERDDGGARTLAATIWRALRDFEIARAPRA